MILHISKPKFFKDTPPTNLDLYGGTCPKTKVGACVKIINRQNYETAIQAKKFHRVIEDHFNTFEFILTKVVFGTSSLMKGDPNN
jgi:hypothetical protein